MSDIIQVNPLVFGGEGESVHANMFVKLWENPNPSASFGPQTIALSSDDYDFTLTIARRLAAYQQDICAITPKGDTVVISVGVAGGSGASCAWRRLDYVSDTSLSAIDCKTATGTAAATTDNTMLVPIAIYGFNKSLDITAIVSNVSTDATKCILSDNVTNVDDAISKAKIEYSSAERKIGKWFGQDLYEKTIDCGALPNATSKAVNHGISNFGCAVNMTGIGISGSASYCLPLANVNGGTTQTIRLSATDTAVVIIASYNASSVPNSYVTIRYTKTS